MEYTVQNLEYAVSVFYNGEQTERANAHAWLTTAQRVPEAWNFVWDLLQPTKGTEVQFYASTTLHTKILRCWNEVPPESYEELGNKLLQAVFTYSNGPKIVTNRLCISLAAFILQQGTVDLATILRPLSNVENTSLLLEVLTVIPEEFNSMTMALELRTKNRIALQQACPAVLDDMLRYLQTVYNDFQEQPSADLIQTWTTAASCACSWLTLDGEDAADNVVLADRMPLCRALLTVVHVLYTWNDAVSDSSLEACEASLAALREAGGARHRHTALQLLADLAALTAPIMRKDDVPNSINEELLLALITCCVALGETHAKALVEVTETNDASENACGARQLLDILLAAQAAPGHYPVHETRSNLVFGFWYTLQDEVLHIIDDTKVIHPVWKEVFSRLLLALVTKSEAAPENNLSKDDLELLSAGGYASWLSSVSGQERCAALGLSSVMAAGAALQRCVAPAALALRKLCADCSAPAADLAPDIVHAARLVLVVGEWSGSAALVSSVVATSVQELAPQPAARPDLSDGLFAMLMALTKKKPEVLNWVEHLLPELVDLGGNSIRVWAPGAVRSVCGWLSALCVARPRAAHARGAALTHALLICIGGVMPRNQVMPVSDLLLSMNRADWGEEEEKLETWLRTSLAPSDFPTPHATHAHKQKFIAGVLRERTSKRRILEVVQEFSLACRGLIGTEYSRQAIASRSLVS